MVKKNNKGFSLIEVIIAAAIFAILIYPITNALISASKTGTKSTKKQYAVETAEKVMESFKTADIESLLKEKDSSKYSEHNVTVANTDTASYTFAVTDKSTESLELPDSKGAVDYTDMTYKCEDIALGSKFETYNCTVEINDASYQVMKNGYVLKDLSETDLKKRFKMESTTKYQTVNVKDTGVTRNLDKTKSAVIVGATYNKASELNNLDNTAYQYFVDAKAAFVDKYPVLAGQYDNGNGADIFSEDSFDKNTIITIEKNAADKTYTVSCVVEYTDHTKLSAIKSEYEKGTNNVYRPMTKYGNGIVYQKTFEKLPVVYFLYIPAIYNGKFDKTGTAYEGKYSVNDTITIDNSKLDSEDKANVYIFTTSNTIDSSYKKVICDTFNVKSLDDLKYTNTKSNVQMDDVEVNVNLAAGTADQKKSWAGKLNAFTNLKVDTKDSSGKLVKGNVITDPDAEGFTVKGTDKDSSSEVYMYDITVTLEDSEHNKTVVKGTRGK